MAISFSPSVNIVRDSSNELEYISTPNSENAIIQINYDFNAGIHSFSLVGSFGTGKSALLWALKKSIQNKSNLFSSSISNLKKSNFEFLEIVSTYNSIEKNFQDAFKLKKKSNFLEELDKRYRNYEAKEKGLAIIIDEFGKILEYASKNNPEKELYDLQQLAEYINDNFKNIILIVTLHQEFDNYASGLSLKQRDEWTKVKGRLKEIVFNEPVEQLLYLAAEKIQNGKVKIPQFSQLIKTIKKSNTFPFKSLQEKDAKKLYPLDILAAAILASALQKYGQNERSLFTFLNSREFQEFDIKDKNQKYFNIVRVYRFLVTNYNYYLFSRYNSDFLHWRTVQSTLQRAESLFEKNYSIYESIIITIGMLSIFASKGAKINREFLQKYLHITEGIDNCSDYIDKLIQYKLIREIKYRNSYILFEGTDIDLDYELHNAAKKIPHTINLADALKKYFDLPPVLAKEHYYNSGAPRYFDFILSESPQLETPIGELDGYINLVISDKISDNDILEFSKINEQAIVYGLIQHPAKLKELIYEIEKVNYVIKHVAKDDDTAIKELHTLLNYNYEEINKYLSDNLFTGTSFINWYYDGNKVKPSSIKEFNRVLSNICNEKYCLAPKLKSELINREKLPGNISSARRILLNRIITSWDKGNLEFPENKYPPEKTIYLSLLKNTGIHKHTDGGAIFTEPKDESFIPLWDACMQFEENSKASKKSIQDFIEMLSQEPFKLKGGLIDFWVSIWLYIRRNDYALFHENKFLPELTVETIDLILKKPQEYFIKAFDLGGIRIKLFNKYRDIINQGNAERINKNTFIETIKPFLILYRNLTDYSKNTKRLSDKAFKLRESIRNAKDPEQSFFEDFPNALGYSTTELNRSTKKLEQFIRDLMNSIRELQESYSSLLNRIENAIIIEFGLEGKTFPNYKNDIQKRYASIKKYILLPNQKTVYSRINSSLDDRDSWINSFIQSLIGKQVERITDEEEEILYDEIRKFKLQFDNLSDFASLNIDSQHQNAVKIEITQLEEKPLNKIISIPKKWNGETKSIEKIIKSNLDKSKSKEQRIFVLSKLLKDELNEE